MDTETRTQRCVIAGGTGLVGRSLLRYMLTKNFYEKVYVLSRRPIVYEDARVEVVVVDYDKLSTHPHPFSGQHYYCCLGTTRKEAGSREAFYQVDYTYAYAFAQLAAADDVCTQFLLLTSWGANPRSTISYKRVKGQLEVAVKKLAIPGIHIFRPSLILGKRKNPRIWEEIGRVIALVARFLMIGGSAKFMAIEAIHIAKAMFHVAKKEQSGKHIYSTNKMHTLSTHKR